MRGDEIREFPVARPIVIVGAARSGTKLLRDLLSSVEGVVGVEYDINYVWMHGAYQLDHDKRDVTSLHPDSREFIRNYLIDKSDGKILVEKTVSNCLRVDLVKAVLPEARFIHLIRDGRDVVASVSSLWEKTALSKKNQPYSALLRKIVQYPYLDAWPYLVRIINDRLAGKVGLVPHIWGPRYPGIQQDILNLPLLTVCMSQWKNCVEESIRQLSDVEDVYEIRYEDLVQRPTDTVDKLLKWLNFDGSMGAVNLDHVNGNHIKKWTSLLNPDDIKHVEAGLRPLLLKLGYLELSDG